MEQVAGHRDQMTAEAIADLIVSFEKASPARIVLANAKTNLAAWPWDVRQTPDYLASVLSTGRGNRAWLQGRDVMLDLREPQKETAGKP